MNVPRPILRVVAYLGTNILGQLVSLILLPIITRYFSPTSYGEYALAMTVSGVVGVLGSSWVANVSFRQYFDARSANRTRSFFFSTLLTQTTIFTGLYILLMMVLALMAPDYLPRTVLISAGAAVISTDLMTQTLSALRAEGMTRAFVQGNIWSAALRLVLTLLGLQLGFRTPTLLFLAVTISQLIPCALAYRALSSALRGPLSLDTHAIRLLVTQGPKAIPFSSALWAERLFHRLILNAYLSTSVVGLYSAAYVLAERTLGALAQALFMMTWPQILRSWTEGGPEAARKAIQHGSSMYIWLTLGPAIFLVRFHDVFVRLVLDSDYSAASPVIPYVIGAAWVSGFTTYLNRQYELRNRFGTLSLLTSIGAAVNIALNFILIPRIGMQGAAIATLSSYCLTGLIYYFARERALVQIPWNDILQTLLLCSVLYGISIFLPLSETVRALIFVVGYAFAFFLMVRNKDWIRATLAAEKPD